MKIIEIINNKKFTIISIFLFFYVFLNLLDGERGLISFYEKQEIKKQLVQKNKALNADLKIMEKKNILLTTNIDLDYLETLYRKNFSKGKVNEKIYIIN